MDTIFIQGIQRRSGTNFLNSLLLMHPDCDAPVVKIREDWFLEEIELLDQYARGLHARWANTKWSGSPYSPGLTESYLGEAMIKVLIQGNIRIPKVLVSKTPSVKNLARFKHYFPSTKLIILVRDPRDVAVSAQKTWSKPITESLRDWAIAAEEIMHFRQAGGDCHLVQYENMIHMPRETINKFLSYCSLAKEDFPFDQVDDLPIYGSSETGRTDSKLQANPAFKSIGRWMEWPDEQKQAVSDIMRKYLDYFDYKR